MIFKKASKVRLAFAAAFAMLALTAAADKQGRTVPQGVEALKGINLNSSNLKDFVTTDRDETDSSKVFFFYNLGTKKFLNIGSYWGVHAALSDVPSEFWFETSTVDTLLYIATRAENFSDNGSSDDGGHYMSYVTRTSVSSNGVFMDRSNSSEDQVYKLWSIAKQGSTNCYTFSLPQRETSSTAKSYLHATNASIMSNANVDSLKYYAVDTDKDGKIDGLYVTAELEEADASDSLSLWKIITLKEYEGMMNDEAAISSDPMDISYKLADPDFLRNNAKLSEWKVDGGIAAQSDSSNPTLRIGFDNAYKTAPGSAWANTTLSNSADIYGRYMSANITNGGRGKLYQEVTVNSKGLYMVSCQGMTNAGARLFAQTKGSGENDFSTAVYTPLQQLATADSTLIFNTTGIHWPLCANMPIYNSAVLLNDEHLTKVRTDYYSNHLMVRVDGPCTLRLGVEVPSASTNAAPRRADGTSTQADVQTEWTSVDNFHLYYLGEHDNRELVLSEEFTNMDYLDSCIHTYDDVTLHLKRTFTSGKWNTIMLPVSLTETQFHSMFDGGSTEGDNDGQKAKLAELYALTDNTVRFVTVQGDNDGNSVFLKAFTPYIIKPFKASGSTEEAYTAKCYKKASSGTSFVEVTADADHFTAEGVTLAKGKDSDASTTASGTDDASYDFAGIKATIDNAQYPYVVSGKEVGTANKMSWFATLCKTYDKNGGDTNAILTGRPSLKNAGAYIMKGGTMYKVPSDTEYGLKGFRVWFQYAEGTASTEAQKQSLKLEIDGLVDDATGIAELREADGLALGGKYAEGVYTLGGARLATGKDSLGGLPKGIYIVDGQKHVVK